MPLKIRITKQKDKNMSNKSWFWLNSMLLAENLGYIDEF